MKTSSIWPLCRQTVESWLDDYAPSMGAALAYYTLFSIAPLLLIVISIAGLVFGEKAAQGQIFFQLRDLMGEQGATAVQSLLRNVNKPSRGIVGATVGAVVLVVGAMTVFGELQNALDRIWRAPARSDSGSVWAIVHSRLLSFGMILGIGFLLMVSLVVSAALAALGTYWKELFGGWTVIAEGANSLLSFAFVTTTFAMIYKLMPRVSIRWHDVWIGAAVTALLFTTGKFLIGLYIGTSAFASGFGAAGSLAALLIWMYYSAQIFLLGAEFTWVYAHVYGSRRDALVPPAASHYPNRSEDVHIDGPVATSVDRSRAALAAAVARAKTRR